MNYSDALIDAARNEWREDGVLSTSTYIRLNNAGIDPDELVAGFITNEDN